MADINVVWPTVGNFGDRLANLPTDYYKALQAGNEQNLREAFQGGLPARPDGSVDYDAMARTLFRLGGAGQVPNATALSNLDLSRQQILNTMRDQQNPSIGVQPVSPRPNEPPVPSAPSISSPAASTTQVPAGQQRDNRGPVTFPPEPQPGYAQQPALQPVNTPSAPAPMAQTQPQAPKAQDRIEQTASYPPKVIAPEDSRGSSPLGLDPERQAQRNQLVYRSTNPAFTKEYREANQKQLEAFDKANIPTPEMKNFDAARRSGYQGSPQQFPIDQAQRTATAQKVGGAIGDTIGDTIEAGRSAYKRIQQLDIMEDALRRGQGNITTGPFADLALKGKQAVSSLFGINLAGVPEAEVAQKIGFGFATQAVKEISNRPAQMEFLKGLENNPGLLLSPKGSFLMIDILRQSAKSDAQLARLAQNRANWDNWQDVMADYYEKHPLMSPFEKGRQLGLKDLELINHSSDPSVLRRQAQDAINQGAPRDKVIRRLRERLGNGSNAVQ